VLLKHITSIFRNCPHDVRFVSTSSCLLESSFLIYVICVCLLQVVSNIYRYCVVFLFCFSSSCCQFLGIVHFWLSLQYSLTFISIIYISQTSKSHWNTRYYIKVQHTVGQRMHLSDDVRQEIHVTTTKTWVFVIQIYYSFNCTCRSCRQSNCYTVKPVYNGHSWEPENVALMSSCPLYTS